MNTPALVIDNGTGYSKLGYAGNSEPSHIVPSLIATQAKQQTLGRKKQDMSDLDFLIGDEALAVRNNNKYVVEPPIREGVVHDWDNMEKYWQRCIYQYLRVDPEDHYVLLTEPPMNTPENREYTAEIMFETFNVPGMYIGVQAVMAIIASRIATEDKRLTGTVIDSGDGVTHVVPVVDGYVIGSCIQHIPLAGSNITKFVQQMLRDRGEPIPPEDSFQVAKKIKESYSYCVPNLLKEFEKFDASPEQKFKTYNGKHSVTGRPYEVQVGYERFLGPEIFFAPDMFSNEFSTPLPTVVDRVIQSSPIDTRRGLYANIVLSGGSTMYKDFGRRLERDIKRFCKDRFSKRQAMSKIALTETKVKVITHPFQRFAVWFGASMLAGLPTFSELCHTKAQYEEIGPSIARHNAVFSSI
ncbi:MAG: hypothetical protein MHM6MM_006629 [Cercozoa sp. M6MM]